MAENARSKIQKKKTPSKSRKENVSYVAEGEPVIYLTNIKRRDILLMDPEGKPESHMTAIEKMVVARTGITKKELESLKKNTGLGYDDLARVLSVTRATLINKKGDEKFSLVLSERILNIADIYSYGYEVFGDKARFNQWMSKPNQAIGGHTPSEYMDNSYGREEVKNIIGRIDYGVYS